MTPAPPALTCLTDPLATSGLRTLFRQRRAGMHFKLKGGLQPLPLLTSDPSVGEALRGGLIQRALLDRKAPLNTLQSHRFVARHAARLAGDYALAELDDAALREVRRRLVAEGRASSTQTKVVSLLRRLHRSWAAANSVAPQVTSRPDRVRRNCPRPSVRSLWLLPQVQALLGAVRDRGVRAVVGLVVGGGLSPQAALSVVVAGLAQDYWTVQTRGPAGWQAVQLPGWARTLLLDYLRHRDGDSGPYLFPSRLNPAQPRGEVNRALQRAQTASPHLRGIPPVSLQVLQRSYGWWRYYAQARRTAEQVQQAQRQWRVLTSPGKRFPDQPEPVQRLWAGRWLPGEAVTQLRKQKLVPPPLPKGILEGRRSAW